MKNKLNLNFAVWVVIFSFVLVLVYAFDNMRGYEWRQFRHQFMSFGFLALGIGVAIAGFVSFITNRESVKLEKMRRDFFANISHELRTPVTVLRCSLDALVDKIVTDPVKIEDYHVQMLKEAKFLERLVGDLLDLSRLQNLDFAIEKNEISMRELVQDAARSAEQLAKKKQVAINLSMSTDDCAIVGDYGRLRQMLIVVLDNAIKFSHENGTIDVSFHENKLSIRDYGAGIPPEQLPFIFGKRGAGLGLAIAKQIAERHGIKIAVESKLGSGAKFIFYRPGI